MNNDLKPKIRFKGFTDDWEQRKLDELYIKGGSGGTPTSTNPNYYNGQIPFLGISDITNSNGLIYSTEKRITDKGLKSSSAWIVPKESISLAMYASVGKLAILKENIATSQAFYNMVFNDLNLRNIVYHRLNLAGLNKEWDSLISMGTQANLNADKVKKFEIIIPLNIDETRKIGELFNQVDNLITLQQRKCDKLEKLKKSLLEKMFPQNNSLIPENRFKGFTDDWEQCKLKDIGEILTGSTPSTTHKEYYSLSGMLWVTPTDINSNIIKTTARMLSNEGEKIARVVPKNTILVTCIASIGKNAIVLEKSSFNQQINSLTPSSNYNPYFLLIDSVRWSNKMKQQSAAGIMQIVNKNEFSEIETMVPTLSEQKVIGKLFQQLDNLITLHQRKHDKLNKIKQALLNDMFI